ncbi:hypothetical protein [Dysgonomonas sp. 25]|uniref:hypothetical protein n=1 Tax=Dysgonomonas sp. 25 TaxID=2302933 RepID=UPI0013D4173C|nr:hypothetical protein [Dysgonomonas sp. 25]NDV68601.1 hypothetical protein [Dysgonomonas sp. 25]
MGTFNTYGQKKKTYGGSNPVWLTVSQKERGGGVLEELPPIGTVLRAGTLVHLDDNVAKVIETFEVAEPVSATDTEVKVFAHGSVLKDGLNLMKSPAALTTAGTGVTVSGTALDSGNNLYKFTIAANAFGVLAKGDILVKASKAGTGAKIFAVPTGITENDVWVEDGDKAATVASVYHGEVMEDRIQPVPECVKAVLPMIKFVKGI